MQIRHATLEDLDDIWQLRLETTELLKSRGIDQWQFKDPSRETFVKDISANEFYVAYEQDVLIGMMAVRSGIEHTYDIIYDGNWRIQTPYLTIHRLAVKKTFLGSEVSKQLLAYADWLAIKNKVGYIRIDTHHDNRNAIRLFESVGYVLCGWILLNQKEGERKRLAFDKKVIA